MRKNVLTLGSVLLVVSLSALAASKEPAKPAKPAKAAKAPDTIHATVVSVSGPAQKLVATNGRKWQKLRAGEKLGELTVVRTGLGAKVVLKFADRGEIVVNNATKIGIRELRKRGQEVKADVGLKYGTMRASVESGRGKNDFRISTPVATLSVRGSSADVGFMADSSRMLDAKAGLWRVLRKLALAQAQEGAAERLIRAGEVANSSPETPITIALQQRASQVYDSFGVTMVEQKTLILNQTGKRINNTPSGGTKTTTVEPTSIIIKDDIVPWPPWP